MGLGRRPTHSPWSRRDAANSAMSSPSAFSATEFKRAVIAQCASDHTRVYATVLDPDLRYLVATTNDGRVVVWELQKHLVGH